MTVFVNAGMGIISSRLKRPPTASAERARDQIYLDLVPRTQAHAQAGRPGEASLHQAFRILWEQFEGHQQQGAVCARVLAFHLLMERTGGRAVEDWVTTSAEHPGTILLDEAVVAAIGCVPLGNEGRLSATDLASAVRQRLRA